MGNLHTIGGGPGTRIRAELHELGGLAEDDSFRAGFLTDALRGLCTLVDGHDTLNMRGGDMAALLKLIADDAERVQLRQMLDADRADPHRGR